jgi:predicted GTPase
MRAVGHCAWRYFDHLTLEEKDMKFFDVNRVFAKLMQDIPADLRKAGVDRKTLETVHERARAVAKEGPRIACVGECGVGKSSTLNALFNAGREISHVRPCTREPGEIRFELECAKGAISALDMPGLGESITADKIHYEKYRKYVPECDVTLWLFQADFRAMTNPQIYIQRLVNDGVLLPERLVVGINKIDLMQPGKWIEEANLPSDEQEKSVEAYVNYVRDVLREIGIEIGDRVIPYSATRRYDLHRLFHAMLSACPRERLWVMFGRKELADFREFVDPSLLAT